MKALANEVAKNLVLAGIGSLTIIDHEPVTENDLDAQFFMEEAHRDEEIIKQGKNVIIPVFIVLRPSNDYDRKY